MKQIQLIPKPPKRMKEPTKDEFRRRAEVARAEKAHDTTPRWWRLWHRLSARIIEKDSQA